MTWVPCVCSWLVTKRKEFIPEMSSFAVIQDYIPIEFQSCQESRWISEYNTWNTKRSKRGKGCQKQNQFFNVFWYRQGWKPTKVHEGSVFLSIIVKTSWKWIEITWRYTGVLNISKCVPGGCNLLNIGFFEIGLLSRKRLAQEKWKQLNLWGSSLVKTLYWVLLWLVLITAEENRDAICKLWSINTVNLPCYPDIIK